MKRDPKGGYGQWRYETAYDAYEILNDIQNEMSTGKDERRIRKARVALRQLLVDRDQRRGVHE